MPQPTEEVERKIGRNLLILQRLELNLKVLLTNATISGPISQLQSLQDSKSAQISRRTMGQLVGDFVDQLRSPPSEPSLTETELTEAHIRISFSIECDSTYYEATQKTMERIVKDRNDLVHQFLRQQDLETAVGCSKACERLDGQYDTAVQALEEIRNTIIALREGHKDLLNHLSSAEYATAMEVAWLRSSRLVEMLGTISNEISRPDGWAVFSTAAHLLRKRESEDVAALKERYGHKTLKSLLLATDLFDLAEEPTSKGGARLLFRIKDAVELINF